MFNFGGCILVNLSLFGNFRTLGVYVELSQNVKIDVFKWKVQFRFSSNSLLMLH